MKAPDVSFLTPRPDLPWLINVCGRIPYPVDSGGRRRVWDMLVHLRRRYNVAIFAEEYEADLEALSEIADAVATTWVPARASGVKNFWQRLERRRQDKRYRELISCCYDFARTAKGRLNPFTICSMERLIQITNPRAVLFSYTSSLFPAGVSAKANGLPLVIDTIDAVHARTESMQAIEGGRREEFFTKEREISWLSQADLLIAIQDEEAVWMRDHVEGVPVVTVGQPFSVSCSFSHMSESKTLLFTGSAADPNVDGICEFVRTIWPVIREAEPESELIICGTVADAISGRDLAQPGVTVKGFVDNLDVEYRKAAVVINPMRYGSGLKIKSVEALARGACLVMTPVAAQGMAGAEKCSAIVKWEQLGETIVGLLHDPSRREELGRKACAYAEASFSEEACFGALDHWLAELGR